MKKLISTVFVACIGGIAALTATHFIYDAKQLSQVKQPNLNQPITLVNSAAMMGGALTTDFTNAAEKSVNAVVHIKTISEGVNNLNYDPFAELFFGPQKRQQNYTQQASGSGVIISDDGYIVTNNHVIAGADKIEVIMNDKRTYVGTIIGADASTDVALIKIKEKNLPFLNYGNSDAVKVGE